MQLAREIEGALRVRRTFHIDADEVFDRDGVVEQFADDVAREFLVDIETHVSKFEADVGVEFALIDLVEKLVVEIATVQGLVTAGNVLAKIIDADARSEFVNGFGSAKEFLDRGSSHKAAGHLLSHRRTFSKMTQGFTFR